MYLHNDQDEFEAAINLTYEKTGIWDVAIEKDYYVTMILRLLSEKIPYAVFKGGTSLQKCHGVINRFSEDIDIAVDTSASQGMRKKMKQAIIDIAAELGLSIPNVKDTHSRRDYNRYIFAYNSVIAGGSELTSAVILETSYTAISFPTVILPVSNYIGKMMEDEAPDAIEKVKLDSFMMKVQRIDRTLADKVFAICDYYLQDRVSLHSRHIYDVYKLLPLVPQDDSFRALVNEVRRERMKSHVCPSAAQECDVPALLLRIADSRAYEADYKNLTAKLLNDGVSYDTAVTALCEIAKSGMFSQ